MAIPEEDKERLNILVQSELRREADTQEVHRETNPKFLQRFERDKEVLGDIETFIDEYESPRGLGYIQRSITVDEGLSYLRSDNVGPEISRSHDWIEI